ITWERAMEITDCLYLMLDRYVSYGATLGGQLPEGGDGINSMSWLCLSSIRRLRLLSPRTALRWHPDMPEEFFKEAVEAMASGATFPTLVNDQVVIPAMISRGASPAHARDYTFCGCGQVTPMGRAYGSYEDIILNSVKPFHLVLHDGMDENHPVQIGPATGHLECFSDYDAFEQAVWRQMEALLEKSISQSNRIKEWGAKNLLDPLRSLLTHSCLEKALDFRAGGADYHEGMVDVVGFASLVDSLNAVRQLVFEEKRMSLMELRDILDQNWDGRESLRLECRNRLSKFGNDEEASDGTAIRLMTRLNEYLSRQKTFMGGPWGLDIIGWSAAVQMGGNTGATPDGRKKGEPIADSGGPAQGRDKKGITAVFRSMVKLPLDKTHGPVALSVRIAGNSLKNTENVGKLKDLLESYMRMGGQQIQVTVADSLLLQEAQNNPDAHRDLIVRVGGFSAYFTQLEKCYQDDIISRSEHSV
ncbi:MAG: pyruvate formate lyase family protein, partial [Clostridia bacterium]